MMMIQTFELTRRYGDLVALDGLDLEVARGDIFGLIGPNGAGKTTTIQILTTLLEPSSGSAYVGGVSLAEAPDEVRRRIGFVPDAPPGFSDLTVREYLRLFAAAHGIEGERQARAVDDSIALTDLGAKADSLIGTLSRGTQQRLAIGRVLIHQPEVLFLDEPASGLDPRARIEMREILRELGAMGSTILISSHVLSDLEEICTSVGFLERGRLLASGRLEDLVRGADRTVLVEVEPAQLEAARQLLSDSPLTESLTDAGAGLHVELASGGTPAELARLLVGASMSLRRLEPVRDGLEDVFMRITKGVVS